MLRRRKKQGQSVIEFLALILFISATFLVFQKYIVRGMAGRWKSAGDAMGQGRIYDPKKTIECRYANFFLNQTPVWFNQTCFEQSCERDCLHALKDEVTCTTCLTTTCQTFYCDD